MSASNQLVYGLTVKEAKDLESDKLFYGEMKEVSTYQEAASDSDLSDIEEIEQQGILDDGELNDRVLRIAVGHEHAEEVGTSHGSTGPPSDLIVPDCDPVYSDIASKLSSGCVCSGNCLSQFTTDEVYMFHLSLFEMSKGERDMLKKLVWLGCISEGFLAEVTNQRF